MRQIASLLWKEWRETRVFLLIALGIFVGLPIIGELESGLTHPHRFALIISPWVMALGGVLAVFVAVGTSCRDLRGRLFDFWRSRPVGVVPWLLVKYIVGLLIVLISCIVPLVLEIETRGSGSVDVAISPEVLLAWCPFLWIALYSIAFLCGCMVRRVAHAAMLAIAAMLLVYFLPLVLPPLESFNISWVIDQSSGWHSGYHMVPWLPWRVQYQPRQLHFLAGMLAISSVALLASLLVVRRDWHVESGQKMMYGSIGSAVLILFASAAFQLGTNLPVLQSISIPSNEQVMGIQSDGVHGVVYLGRREFGGGRSAPPHEDMIRSIRFGPSGVELGPPIRLGTWYWTDRYLVAGFWTPAHPEVAYVVGPRWNSDRHHPHLTLKIVNLADGRISVLDSFLDISESNWAWPRVIGLDDRMFVLCGDQTAEFDIRHPLEPRVISTAPLRFGEGRPQNDPGSISFPLPLIAGMSARQRLEMRSLTWAGQIKGDSFFNVEGNGLRVYQLDTLSDSWASFQQIGQYESTLLEQVFGSFNYATQLGNGLVYVSNVASDLPTSAARLTVYDVHDPKHPVPAGHFAVPDDATLVVCPLPDARALVGGSKLYLLGPPASVRR